MNKPKDTHELFDKFFESRNAETTQKTRMQIDRPEVYTYEMKIGKQLIDMDADELFEMILTFGDNRRSGSNNNLSYNSFFQIASMYRQLFYFYMDEYDVVIRNPFNNPKMKGSAVIQRLAEKKEAYTWDKVEEIIEIVRSEYEEERANYIECIILLYYNGFARAEEIVNLTEDMIDFKNHSIRSIGRTIQLSDRCFELLTYVSRLTEIDGVRGGYSVVPWRDKYFKYIIRPKEESSFNDRSVGEVANLINRRLLTDVKKKFGVEINYRVLYLLGFYDYMVKLEGKDRVKELILAVRSPEETEDLIKLARDYGVVADNVSQLKRVLRPFI